MEQTYDIFLSYDRDDLPRVQVLVSALERQAGAFETKRHVKVLIDSATARPAYQ